MAEKSWSSRPRVKIFLVFELAQSQANRLPHFFFYWSLKRKVTAGKIPGFTFKHFYSSENIEDRLVTTAFFFLEGLSEYNPMKQCAPPLVSASNIPLAWNCMDGTSRHRIFWNETGTGNTWTGSSIYHHFFFFFCTGQMPMAWPLRIELSASWVVTLQTLPFFFTDRNLHPRYLEFWNSSAKDQVSIFPLHEISNDARLTNSINGQLPFFTSFINFTRYSTAVNISMLTVILATRCMDGTSRHRIFFFFTSYSILSCKLHSGNIFLQGKFYRHRIFLSWILQLHY